MGAPLKLARFDFASGPDASALDVTDQRSWDEGFTAGGCAAQAEAEVARDAEIARLAAECAVLSAGAQTLREQVFVDAAALMRAVFTAVLPALSRRGFADEAANALARLVSRTAPKALAVTAAPATGDALAAALQALGAGEVKITADDALAPDAARVRWAGGGAEIDADELLAEANRIYEAHASQADKEHADD